MLGLKYLACILFILTGFFILLSVGVILVQAQRAIPEHTGGVSGVMQGFSWGLGALFLAPLGVIGQNYGVDKILILMENYLLENLVKLLLYLLINYLQEKGLTKYLLCKH